MNSIIFLLFTLLILRVLVLQLWVEVGHADKSDSVGDDGNNYGGGGAGGKGNNAGGRGC